MPCQFALPFSKPTNSQLFFTPPNSKRPPPSSFSECGLVSLSLSLFVFGFSLFVCLGFFFPLEKIDVIREYLQSHGTNLSTSSSLTHCITYELLRSPVKQTLSSPLWPRYHLLLPLRCFAPIISHFLLFYQLIFLLWIILINLKFCFINTNLKNSLDIMASTSDLIICFLFFDKTHSK